MAANSMRAYRRKTARNALEAADGNTRQVFFRDNIARCYRMHRPRAARQDHAASGAARVGIAHTVLDRRQRLLQIGPQIVDVLYADGQAHHVLGHAGQLQFRGRQLPVGGGRRMAGERLGVTDVDQARE